MKSLSNVFSRSSGQRQERDEDRGKFLHVLLVDDRAADRALVIRALRGEFSELQVTQATDPAQFAEALAGGGFDLAITDYRLHWTDGLAVLRAAKARWPDCPVIMFTDTHAEHVAVEAMKAGLEDYVLRTPKHYVRLADAVHIVLERARQRQAVKEADTRYQSLFERIPVGIYRSTSAGQFLEANPALVQMLGYPDKDSLLAANLSDLYVNTEAGLHWQTFLESEGLARKVEVPLRRRDGLTFWAQCSARAVRGNRGEILYYEGSVVDISDRKLAEEALRESENRLRSIVENEPECVKVVAPDGTLLEMNSAGLAMIEAESAEAVVGQSVYPLVAPEHQEAFRNLTESVCRGNKGTLEFEVVGLKGTRRWVETHAVPFGNGSTEKFSLLGISRDVTDRRRAEEALRRSEASYRSLVEGAPYGIYRSTADGKFQSVNPALVHMLGYDSEEELLTLDMSTDVYQVASERTHLLEVFRERFEGVEVQWKRKDGTPITVRLSGRAVCAEPGDSSYFEGIAENVTEQRVLEHQLRLAQKMEAVGQLAGGIAHDFNNLLGVIIGYSEILTDRLDTASPLRNHAEEIKKAGNRAATLTRQLLAFSRQQVLQPRVIDLNSVVADLEKMLRRLISEDVELVTVFEPALGQVKADPGQIEQVLMNLAVNARDAMPHGGKLIIETLNTEVDQAYARRRPLVRPGRYVVVAMSDTGVGMDAKTQTHIFEPFFTTKEQGKGTGLGLATVYGIVKQSGGFIWVYSELGKGTTFKIYLPRIDEAVEAAGRDQDEPEVARGSETILLVEDADSLRELTREFLQSSGYIVLDAADSTTAMQLSKQHKGPIHLLLTDVVMPGLSGRQLAERLTNLRTGMKVIYMSGYTDDAIVHHGVLERGTVLIQKPFTRVALTQKVREVLGVPEVHQ